MITPEAKALMDALQAPFAIEDLKAFPAAMNQGKKSGKVAVFADSRIYMKRLDDAVGPSGWCTEYEEIDQSGKVVKCKLSLDIGGVWVSKYGYGYPNEASDADKPGKEPFKAAKSDALKLACVEWGVGRYLYFLELERDWLPLDDNQRFAQPVKLRNGEVIPSTVPSSQASQARPQQAPRQQGQAQAPKPNRSQAERPAAPADKDEAFRAQLGDYAAPNGSIHAGKWNDALKQANLTKGDIVAVTGETPAGGWAITKWLMEHPEKSLDDLILIASQQKEAA